MLKVLLIGIGGSFGALARYGLSGLAHRWISTSFPLGTLLVNTLGCIAIGGAMCLVEERQLLSTEMRLLLLIGFLGSFTTFATFGYETFEMLHAREIWTAAWNVALNVALGAGSVAVGWMVVKALRI